MKHSFLLDQLDPLHCKICKREMIDHTDRATCESCGASGTCNINFGDTLLCQECEDKDVEAQRAKQSTIERIKETINSENGKVNINSDIFNAEVISINDIIKALAADESISNKNFALAQILDARFKHLSSVIHDASQAKTEAENQQRAVQVTYNELAKKLRAEEREAIKLKDITYQPVSPPPSKQKVVKVKKFDSKSIRIAAREHGIPEQVLQMMCIRHDITVEQAVKNCIETGLGHL